MQLGNSAESSQLDPLHSKSTANILIYQQAREATAEIHPNIQADSKHPRGSVSGDHRCLRTARSYWTRTGPRPGEPPRKTTRRTGWSKALGWRSRTPPRPVLEASGRWGGSGTSRAR